MSALIAFSHQNYEYSSFDLDAHLPESFLHLILIFLLGQAALVDAESNP
jgi:hypothetical protein